MRALDTNVIVRFLIADDAAQARKVRRLFEEAERTGDRFLVTMPALLETIWVLTAVYEPAREDVVGALEMLSQMPILEFEDYDGVQHLIRLGRSTNADLPDLVIGLAGRSHGCPATLTFEKGLGPTGLFERL